MAEIDFTPRSTISHVDTGEYTGRILEIKLDKKRNALWFLIDIENLGVLNTPLSLNSEALNKFALKCLNNNNKFDTDNALNKEIRFRTIDKNIDGNIYSHITEIDFCNCK